MDQIIKICKSLGEPTRIKILRLLAVRSMYVCELEAVLKISQPRISQHLRVLKEAGLVSERKEAQRTFYKFNLEVMEDKLHELISFFHTDLGELTEFSKEYRELQNLPNNQDVIACKQNIKEYQ